MTWIPDVVTLTTIASTWGNNVRNHLVQTFDSTAEANAHLTVPDGVLCTIAPALDLYVKRGGAWVLVEPRPIVGRILNPGPIGAATFRTAECNIPAGFSTAFIHYHALTSPSDGSSRLHVEVKVFTANGGTQVQVGEFATESFGATVTLSTLAAVNPAGDIVSVTVSGFNPSVFINTYPDAQNHRLDVVAYPRAVLGG